MIQISVEVNTKVSFNVLGIIDCFAFLLPLANFGLRDVEDVNMLTMLM